MQNKPKKFVISAYEECEIGDALDDLASVNEYLCETEEYSSIHRGLYVIHRLMADNLEMLARRSREKKRIYQEADDELMMND